VTLVILCILALLDLVVFASFTTKLGEVKIYLNACMLRNEYHEQLR